jgi:hypothetical protein
MVILNWVKIADGNEVDGKLIRAKPQNAVKLRDTWAGANEPAYLTICEQLSLIESVRRFFTRHGASEHNHVAYRVEDGRSETGAWEPGTTCILGQTEWRFRDGGNGNAESGPLYVTNADIGFGESTKGPWTPEPGFEAKILGQSVKASVKIPIGRTTRIKKTIHALRDPLIQCSLLLPWEEGRSNLIDFMSQGLDIPANAMEGALVEILGEPNVGLSLPEGWTVQIDHHDKNFELSEGESRDVSLQVDARSAGKALLALRAEVENRPDEAIVSDLLLVEAGE